MKTHHPVIKLAAAACLVGLLLTLAPSQASAGWRRRTVVVTTPTVYSPYVTTVPTVYSAPVTTVYSAPLTTTSTVVSAPVRAVYSAPAVVSSPVVSNPVVQTSYLAPAVVPSTYVIQQRGLLGRRLYVYP